MKKSIKTNQLWIVVAMVTCLAACQGGDKAAGEREISEVGQVTKANLDSLRQTAYFDEQHLTPAMREEFEKFYQARNYELAWNTRKQPLPVTDSLIAVLDSAHLEGLEPETYQGKEIKEKQKAIYADSTLRNNLNNLVALDFFITARYLTYASHLVSGRIDPHAMDTTWIIQPRKVDLAKQLTEALADSSIQQSLQKLLPADQQYHKLKAQLARHRSIAAQGGWPTLSAYSSLRKDSKDKAVITLRKRLAYTGLLDSTTATAHQALYDDSLVAVVKRFQALHSLDTTGEINNETFVALNTPIDEVIEKIKVNMERIRWQPDNTGGKHLWVNVPGYELIVAEDTTEVMHMNVIVGEEYASTPLFSDTLEYVIFSPNWTIPATIARKELLPMLQKDPLRLQKDSIDIYDSWDTVSAKLVNPRKVDWKTMAPEAFNYRLVQRPGTSNPLGGVKFMFPNPLFIYLHDTPASHLFTAKDRNLSHGCIRVEKPKELVSYLLAANTNWNEKKITRSMHLKKPMRVELDEKIPIGIVYRTVWVDQQGLLHSGKDIYGHDATQLAALRNKSAALSLK
jgi:murein L,D-transpeptidase YcbB/YkuD